MTNIEKAIEAIKNNELIIVTDDESRENEGDFICAGENVTGEMINIMAKYGRGLICTPMSEEVAQNLDIPLMVVNNTDKDVYKRQATNGASAPAGLLIPPSNALITYSLVSGGTSVAALFLAGYIPGLIWALACTIVAVAIAKKKGYKGTEGKFSWSNLGRATLAALPSLGLIVVVIGGIVAGVFTATEGSAISVVYSLILGLLYKNLNFKKIINILVESAKMSAIVVFLIGVSNILSWVMAFTGIPQMIGESLLSITTNPIIILLIMNVILLISGTFMDVTPAILIFTPLFLPIVQEFGIHPVQFGLIIVYNLCIGNITPPVGNTLFVAIKIGDTTLAKVMPYMLRYYALILIGLLLVTYVPAISLGLPQAAGLI